MTRSEIISAVWELENQGDDVPMNEIETAYDNYVLSLARDYLAADHIE